MKIRLKFTHCQFFINQNYSRPNYGQFGILRYCPDTSSLVLLSQVIYYRILTSESTPTSGRGFKQRRGEATEVKNGKTSKNEIEEANWKAK